jgi:hypothetical protein
LETEQLEKVIGAMDKNGKVDFPAFLAGFEILCQNLGKFPLFINTSMSQLPSNGHSTIASNNTKHPTNKPKASFSLPVPRDVGIPATQQVSSGSKNFPAVLDHKNTNGHAERQSQIPKISLPVSSGTLYSFQLNV